MIPLYPWESMMVPVAQWMGITAIADLQDVFPNFANFNSTLLNTDVANEVAYCWICETTSFVCSEQSHVSSHTLHLAGELT